MENAQTQLEINQCAGINLLAAKRKLVNVLEKIRHAYKSASPDFLTKLDVSQKAWEESLEADMEMKYPLEDKRLQYGSVYPMCASGFESRLVLARVEFLKEWLKGHQDGDICSGSIIHSYSIQRDCSNIGK
ncbi:lysozyme inhibitor LprI family protein [Porticoccus hydrocarbonoclasticus]|uniref:lysozyme inhibitor LprI family protein n=1 Tax=Porticoccus TaxID=1123967 RepID=UPI002353E4B1|nr:lysozyme inhibitor LprI family protein [Porticoccus hydrocarbonoclasticus]